MEHLLNCHGEWAMLLAVFANVPFLGLWLRARLHSDGGEK
jgi:hypothetical protein